MAKKSAPAKGYVVPSDPGALAPELLRPFDPWMESFHVRPNHPDNEWPWNILSKKAVAYASGRIAREGDDPDHRYDRAELDRGWTLANDFAARVVPVQSPYAPFVPLFLPANVGDPVPEAITPAVIRAAFRGTLHPWCRPHDVNNDDDAELIKSYVPDGLPKKKDAEFRDTWAAALNWFRSQKGLVPNSFQRVSIHWFMEGPQLPELLVALTRAGSVVGLASTRLQQDGMAEYQREWVVENTRFSCTRWFEKKTDRFTPRGTLAAVDDAAFIAWHAAREPEAEDIRERDQPLDWRAHLRRFPVRFRVPLSPNWGTLHRCLSWGFFNHIAREDAPNPFFQHAEPGIDITDKWPDRLFQATPVNAAEVSRRLAELSEDTLRENYRKLRATDYAPFLSEADLDETLRVFRDVKAFYAQAAAAGLRVHFHVTTRTEEELEAEAAAYLKGTAAPVAAPADTSGHLTGCVEDPERLKPLLACMDTFGEEDDEDDEDDEDNKDWPHNSISIRTVAYTCGRLAVGGAKVAHKHDPAELERCRTLATDAAARVAGILVIGDQMGPFRPFFVTANVGDKVPKKLTEKILRAAFGKSICPENQIEIEPMKPAGDWWEWYVTRYIDEGEDEAKEQEAIWSKWVTWFTKHPGLHGHAFVRIGIGDDDRGANHPRLAVAFTDQGSLVGICGHVTFG